MLEWADLTFIMDDQQRRSLRRRFAGHPTLQHLVCLDIPDDFTFMQPELVDLLTVRAAPQNLMRGVIKTRVWRESYQYCGNTTPSRFRLSE